MIIYHKGHDTGETSSALLIEGCAKSYEGCDCF